MKLKNAIWLTLALGLFFILLYWIAKKRVEATQTQNTTTTTIATGSNNAWDNFLNRTGYQPGLNF